MTKLSVNVNKLATLRNAREKNLPNVAQLTKKILSYGAHGITIHPRPDGRHIRTHDIWEIHQIIQDWNIANSKVEFNIEGYPSKDFIKMIERAKPDQVTLVPDPPEALTSNAGWDLVTNELFLKDVSEQLRSYSARVSLFVEPYSFDTQQTKALERLNPERIELYTEAFSDAYETAQQDSVTRNYVNVARTANSMGIKINAGHDLNQRNLKYLVDQIPQISEVSIGHALICEALEDGLEQTVRAYLKILSW